MSSAKNPHQILGVREGASKDEIKSAFRKLARRWHPDKNPLNASEAEIRFKNIVNAYEALMKGEGEIFADFWSGKKHPDNMSQDEMELLIKEIFKDSQFSFTTTYAEPSSSQFPRREQEDWGQEADAELLEFLSQFDSYGGGYRVEYIFDPNDPRTEAYFKAAGKNTKVVHVEDEENRKKRESARKFKRSKSVKQETRADLPGSRMRNGYTRSHTERIFVKDPAGQQTNSAAKNDGLFVRREKSPVVERSEKAVEKKKMRAVVLDSTEVFHEEKGVELGGEKSPETEEPVQMRKPRNSMPRVVKSDDSGNLEKIKNILKNFTSQKSCDEGRNAARKTVRIQPVVSSTDVAAPAECPKTVNSLKSAGEECNRSASKTEKTSPAKPTPPAIVRKARESVLKSSTTKPAADENKRNSLTQKMARTKAKVVSALGLNKNNSGQKKSRKPAEPIAFVNKAYEIEQHNTSDGVSWESSNSENEETVKAVPNPPVICEAEELWWKEANRVMKAKDSFSASKVPKPVKNNPASNATSVKNSQPIPKTRPPLKPLNPTNSAVPKKKNLTNRLSQSQTSELNELLRWYNTIYPYGTLPNDVPPQSAHPLSRPLRKPTQNANYSNTAEPARSRPLLAKNNVAYSMPQQPTTSRQCRAEQPQRFRRPLQQSGRPKVLFPTLEPSSYHQRTARIK